MATLAERVAARAGRRCEYCRLPDGLTLTAFTLDHDRPRKRRGGDGGRTGRTPAFHCNARKGPNASGFDLTTNELVPLLSPRRQIWADRFFWNGPYLGGRTAVGRATVDVLCINLPDRVEQRRALAGAGEDVFRAATCPASNFIPHTPPPA